ncbi:MAG: hypothetical protein KGL90_09920 [Burkholderiales bacterium]|nr:hypothetical protein [Burkholderiales bacterium]
MRQHRHEVDRIRTVCWFNCLWITVGAKRTHQMDVLIERPLDLGHDATTDLKNKWRSYSKGAHVPQPRLVDAIDLRFAGSRALLNHPCWQLLRTDSQVMELIPTVLVSLPPAVYAVVRNSASDNRALLITTDGWGARRLRKLERHVGLDSLACLVALLRLSAESGSSGQSFDFGCAVCRMLLIMGPWLFAHGIAQSIVEYVEGCVLPMATHNGQRPGFGELGFLQAARRLSGVANLFEANENKVLTNIQRVELRLDLLDDKYSLELSELVGAVTMPTTSSTCEAER